ncbi:hypothetical protein OG225_42760 (plasmid) [Nocardia sp. NBC_01377]|uniref:DUF6545 domain-containing protein n=1 Tax=Nocardia sp. NBC_01377 TaxID=2903595 RepID=UPI002F90A3E1
MTPPSPLLVTEATSVVPGVAATALVGWIVILMVLRMTLMLERSRLDWAIATLIGAYVCVAVLRVGTVQSVFTEWIALADVRLATHISALIGAGAVLWIGLLWRTRTPVSRWTMGGIVTAVVVLGVTLAWLSMPARQANIAVEELGNWRTPAYMMVYSLPTPLAEIPVLITSFDLIRRWRQSGRRAVLGIVTTSAIALSMIDSFSRISSAWLVFHGVDNELTEARASSNDLLFLGPISALMLLAIPSIVESTRIRLRSDPASRNIRTLEPLWNDLMLARPATRLQVQHRDSLPQVTEHRMRIEIEDVMLSVAGPLAALDDRPTPGQVCAALRAALSEEIPDGSGSEVIAPDWLEDERFILAVARVWKETQQLPTSANV